MAYHLKTEDIPHYDYEDYKLWEGDWELIKGLPYAMSPAPNWRHQRLGSKLVSLFDQALTKAKKACSCDVLYECDWIVNSDTVVRPDIMIVCEPIEGAYPTKPPVLVVEIVSPQSVLKDRNTKFSLYQSYGVKYYLIGSVEKEQVEIFVLTNNRYEQADDITMFQLTKHCAMEADVKLLFE